MIPCTLTGKTRRGYRRACLRNSAALHPWAWRGGVAMALRGVTRVSVAIMRVCVCVCVCVKKTHTVHTCARTPAPRMHG